MADPNITVDNITRNKISDETGYTDCDFDFSVDQRIIDFEVRASSTSRMDGIIVEQAEVQKCSNRILCSSTNTVKDFNVAPNIPINCNINYTELTLGDGEYPIQIYVQAKEDGKWY